MTLHVEVELDVHAYGDSAKENCHAQLNIPMKVVNVMTNESSGRVALAGSATDVAFGMNGITAGKIVMLKSDSPFSFKLNGTGNTPVVLKPRTNTSDNSVMPAFAVLATDAITSLHFTNPGASAIDVDVAVLA